jgi:ribosomal protein S18 acetylase RimI-like enzyme
MAAESADAILAGRVRDLYFGGFEPSGMMMALSMLRGWDDGFEVPSFGIVVDHAAQGRGIGKQMTAWTVAQARQAGAAAVRLSVYDDNPRAVAIYEREGFAEVERHDEGSRARIVMRIELDSS